MPFILPAIAGAARLAKAWPSCKAQYSMLTQLVVVVVVLQQKIPEKQDAALMLPRC